MKKEKKIRILMAGGGTGGHVMPIVNIVDAICAVENASADLYRYGKYGSLEESAAKQINEDRQDTVVFRRILSGKIRRDGSVFSAMRNIVDMCKVFVGVVEAIGYMIHDRVDIIRCKGGYVAAPVIVASWVLGIPIVVHESDTRMGMINRLASRKARMIFTAFEGVHDNGKIIGQLLSDHIAYSSPLADFELLIGRTGEKKKTRVLVMGGSQGSQSLYESIAQAMKKNPEVYGEYLFVVVGGLLSKNLAEIFSPYDNVIVLDFLNQKELSLCYQYCDIAITRAGTTSLAEQKLRNMLLVMVPIPRTHDQESNAERYVHRYGDVLVRQDDGLEERMTEVLSVLGSYQKKNTLSDECRLARVQEPKKEIIKALFTLVSSC